MQLQCLPSGHWTAMDALDDHKHIAIKSKDWLDVTCMLPLDKSTAQHDQAGRGFWQLQRISMHVSSGSQYSFHPARLW